MSGVGTYFGYERNGCEVCGARVTTLRRRRCTLCYLKWAESRPVGLGAACLCCNERRRSNLKMAEILGSFVPMCFNCCGRIGRLRSMPSTWSGLRAALIRDRRDNERRKGNRDTRVFKIDRRKTERRLEGGSRDDCYLDIEDSMIVEMYDMVDERAREPVVDMTTIHRPD